MSRRPASLPARLSLASREKGAAFEADLEASPTEKGAHAPSETSDLPLSPIEPLPSALPSHVLDEKSDRLFQDAHAAHVHRRVVRTPHRRSLCGMYRWCSRRDCLLLLVPGLLLGVVSGGLPVGMTHIVGRAFAAFAAYNPSVPHAASALAANVRTDVYVLLGLAAGSLLVRSASAAAWLILAENGAHGWRQYVFRAVLAKDISWFDLGMGLNTDSADVGAAGLMALFLKDTDDVRTAMGQQMGYLVMHAAAAIASFVYAMYRQWSLTLVIFASIPVLALITVAGDLLGAPLQAAERAHSMQLSALVEKGASAIRTVKVFNAERMQLDMLRTCITQCRTLYTRMCAVWGVRYGLSSALGLLMFVQGFAWGSHLVRNNQAGPDVVLATFLASLVTMGQLQSILMRLNFVERGKNAAANLVTLASSRAESDATRAPPPPPPPAVGTKEAPAPVSPTSTLRVGLSVPPVVRIPKHCSGEMTLDNVWMNYPARPEVPALRGVSMYFAAGEHTFVVGRSGSGKSTVASVLLRLHTPQSGVVALDATDVHELDIGWFRSQVVGVTQEPLILEQTLFENVRAGLPLTHAGVTVRQAISAVRLDDLLDVLPDGLDTPLGQRGTALSGGQMQRVALARALLRDAPVLVLDEATSALDAACARQVHNAVRAWRQGRTTVVITHTVAHIRPDDYCYVMDEGRVVEEGYRRLLAQRDGSLARTYLDKDLDAALASPVGLPDSASLYTHEGPVPSASVWSMASSLESGTVHHADLHAAESAAPRIAARHQVKRVAPAAAAPPSSTLLLDTIRTMWATVPHRAWTAVALVVCVASGLTSPVFAYCLTQVLMVVGRASAARLAPLIGATAGVAVADGVFRGARLISMEALVARWVASMRLRAMERVVKQDAAWFDRAENAPSALATIVVKNAEDAGACLGQMLGQLVALGAMLLATIVWAFVQGWQLTMCALALVPLVAGLYGAQGHVASRAELASKAQREHVAHLLCDQVGAVRAVRAMALDAVLRADAQRAIERAAHAGRRAALASAAGAGLADATVYAAEALLYGIGAVLLIHGTYDLHRFMMVLNPVIFAVGFAAQLATSLPASSRCMHALRAVTRLLDLRGTPSDAVGDATPTLRGNLALDDVCFSYGTQRVLDHVSLRIDAGERVALIGASGAGKSTFAALLQRLYEPDAGAVRVDGYDARTVHASWLRAHMAVVSQMPTLFPATIHDNIALGAAVSDAEVRGAARRAGAAFVEALPQQFATRLGRDATQLSGGQAQRIAIARALVRTTARVLVLDEFTAAFDPATRTAVADAVFRDDVDAPTVLVLTHDAALMRRCDRVVVLRDGRIAYDGPPSPLLDGGP